MKRLIMIFKSVGLLSILYVVTCSSVVAQSESIDTTKNTTITKVLDGFLGMKWGSSKKIVKQTMMKRQKLKVFNETDYELRLEGGTFANRPVDKWVFEFYQNKLASAMVIYDFTKRDLEAGANLSNLGLPLVLELCEKYGQPSFYEKKKINHTWIDDHMVASWDFNNGTIRHTYHLGVKMAFVELLDLICTSYRETELDKKCRVESEKRYEEQKLKEKKKALQDY